ncbi:hypothetical protein [Nostoc sp. LEGE 06077]|uniref:hypothetical protein n=1 Tax=Nostoc sp. LEGE 06077 TaxID=915325 RepID=UPI001882073A|nr:hypothetical protein [Nostoc sp. LEGE 06077]
MQRAFRPTSSVSLQIVTGLVSEFATNIKPICEVLHSLSEKLIARDLSGVHQYVDAQWVLTH